MIIDSLKNWNHYPLGLAWKNSFEFLKSLTFDSEEKKYIIQGDEIFAQITSYETRTPDKCLLETHKKYVDIQTVLSGVEKIECYSRDDLEIKTPYSESKDAEFYKRTSGKSTDVNLCPGKFIVFFPQDAHMPSLVINENPQLVKKVVVKINIDLLLS